MTDYHKIRAFSRGLAHTLLSKSPAHAFAESEAYNPAYQAEPPTPEMERGTAAHALILEGRDIVIPVNADSYRKKAAQEMRDEVRGAGFVPMLADAVPEFRAMCALVRERIEAYFGMNLTASGVAEQPIYWQQDDLACKCKSDWLSNDATLTLDLKFSESTPAQWMRQIGGMGYDLQDAHYCDGVEQAHGARPRFVFCIADVRPPAQVFFVTLDATYRAIAQSKLAHARRVWVACVEAGQYPGYPDTHVAEPMPWELRDAEILAIEAEQWTKEDFLFGRVLDRKGN